MIEGYRISPLGDSAIVIEFGTVISPELNDIAIAFCDLLSERPFPGFIEAAPAFASATIYYDPVQVLAAGSTGSIAFDMVKERLQAVAASIDNTAPAIAPRSVEIPFRYDADLAPDLEYLADQRGIGADEVIRIFTSRTYRVYMLGFLPGFAYMGEVDQRIAASRKACPRTSVPKGSVAIAGRQTGIYPLDSPGGWQIIGRTDVELFTPGGEFPTLLRPGDQVRFIPQ